ncbi:MAG: IclR family transcriptional regulator [Chloroflexota bacterium]
MPANQGQQPAKERQNHKGNNRTGNQSIKRAFAILDVVAANQEGIGVSEIAAQIDVHKSTVSRMLATLEEVQAVERVSHWDGYRIGDGLVSMLAQLSYPRHLVTLARPYLQALADATSETINLSLPDGDMSYFVDQIDSQYHLSIRDWTGYRIPLHATASGKIFLSHRTPEQIEAYLNRPLERYTDCTLAEPNALRSHLAEVRAQGYGWTHGEYEEQIIGVAAPVKGSNGQVIACINVCGPSFRFPPEDERDMGKSDDIVQLLLDITQQVQELIKPANPVTHKNGRNGTHA